MNPTLHRRTLATLTGAVAAAAVVVPVATAAAADPVLPAPVTLIAAPSMPSTSDLLATPDGTSYAGMATSNGTTAVARVVRRLPDAAWEQPVELSNPIVYSTAPQLVERPDGGAAAVWSEFPGGNASVWYAEQPAGGTWSAAERVTADGRDAQLSVGADGTVVVVWRTTSTYRVQGAARPAGGGWSAPITLSAPGYAADHPQVVVDPTGAAVATWTQISGTGPGISTIRAARRSSEGAWSDPVVVSVPQAETAAAPALVLDDDGAATVAWVQYFVVDEDHHIGRVQTARLAPGSEAWSSPVNLSAAGVDAQTFAIAVAPDGVTTATWVEDHADTSDVLTSRGTAGSWSDPVVIGGGEAGYTAEGMTLDVGPGARVVAGWIGTRADGAREIDVATSDADHRWQGARPVADTGYPAGPRFTIDGGGDVTVVWTQVESGYRVQAAFVDRSAPVVGALTVPTAGAAGAPLGFAVTASDHWSEITDVTWDFGDGGTGSGAEVTHAYVGGGAFPVTVTVTDGAGNTVSASGTVAVTPRPTPIPTPTPTTKAPRIESAHLDSTRIRAVGARVKAPRRARLELRLSGAATVRVAIAGARRGRSGAALVRSLPAGSSTVPLSARIGKRTLRPGRYVVTVVATNAAGSSEAVRLALRVVRPARR